MKTCGMDERPVRLASAGANPAPPSVVFHSTAVNGTPSAASACFAAALNGQYVALKTTTSSLAMMRSTAAADVSRSNSGSSADARNCVNAVFAREFTTHCGAGCATSHRPTASYAAPRGANRPTENSRREEPAAGGEEARAPASGVPPASGTSRPEEDDVSVGDRPSSVAFTATHRARAAAVRVAETRQGAQYARRAPHGVPCASAAMV